MRWNWVRLRRIAQIKNSPPVKLLGPVPEKNLTPRDDSAAEARKDAASLSFLLPITTPLLATAA